MADRSLEIQDADYSTSYARTSIHEEMIKDNIRTGTYHDSILKNRHLFKNKVVMDVGCGTGILSLFAAQAGAKRVFAIDMSDIADSAVQIVKANNFDNVISIIKCKAEDIKSLPDNIEKVDIIISEWMGYTLFYESMLTSVIYCRDRWLVDGGLIFPDEIILYLAAIQDYEYKENKVNWWSTVYGFDMRAMIEKVIKEPIVDVVEEGNVCTDAVPIFTVNMHTIKANDENFSSRFRLTMKRNDYAHAFLIYFDTNFTHCHRKVSFSTGPFSQPTHWKQTILYMKDYITGFSGEYIEGEIALCKNSRNHRFLDISINFKFEGNCASLKEENKYYMG